MKARRYSRQRNLIQALRGFVPDDRLVRLEKAMQAAKMAKIATAVMTQRGLLSGGR